jgi:hypothetical protein
MKRRRLTQEIISAILDSFRVWNAMGCHNQHAINTLRTCSLVCRSWLPLCQRPLFHTIELATRTCCGGCLAVLSHSRRLNQLLLDSPHLAGYIRDLRLQDIRCRTCKTRWMATDETLPSMLRKLGNLQKLEVRELRWSTFAADLRQSLCWVLQLPSMIVLDIGDARFRSLDDFSKLIAHVGDLKGLSLSDFRTSLTGEAALTSGDREEMGDGRVLTGNNRRRLHELSLMSYAYPSSVLVLVEWLLGPRSLVDLSHVEVLGMNPQGDAVNRLLQTIGSSLKFLRLHLPQDLVGE